MNETPYRESAEMPAEPAEPVWPKIWAALKRLGLILLVSAGPVASVCLWRLGDVAILLDLVAYVFGVIVPIVAKSVKTPYSYPNNWFEKRSWSEIALLASWAPFAFPMLGLWRLGRWVGTGKCSTSHPESKHGRRRLDTETPRVRRARLPEKLT